MAGVGLAGVVRKRPRTDGVALYSEWLVRVSYGVLYIEPWSPSISVEKRDLLRPPREFLLREMTGALGRVDVGVVDSDGETSSRRSNSHRVLRYSFEIPGYSFWSPSTSRTTSGGRIVMSGRNGSRRWAMAEFMGKPREDLTPR